MMAALAGECGCNGELQDGVLVKMYGRILQPWACVFNKQRL